MMAVTALGAEYTNPVGIPIADPVVLHEGNDYYLYGTTSNTEGFVVYSSPDLVHWTERGFAYHKTSTSWGKAHFWAPSIVKYDSAFYLFYSAIGDVGGYASHRICVAKSPTPLGPFVDVKAPLLNSLTAAIDPHILIDDSDAYIYYSLDVSENGVSRVYVSRLSKNLMTVEGERVLCVEPSADWEGKIWNEAPYVIKYGKKYILMYSARGFFEPEYSVGYAVSDSPMGPWMKATENPILSRTDKVSGPGHNCVTESPSGKELFILYHVHRFPTDGWQRELAIDRMTITEESDTVKIKVYGPTSTPQPMPK